MGTFHHNTGVHCLAQPGKALWVIPGLGNVWPLTKAVQSNDSPVAGGIAVAFVIQWWPTLGDYRSHASIASSADTPLKMIWKYAGM